MELLEVGDEQQGERLGQSSMHTLCVDRALHVGYLGLERGKSLKISGSFLNRHALEVGTERLRLSEC